MVEVMRLSESSASFRTYSLPVADIETANFSQTDGDQTRNRWS